MSIPSISEIQILRPQLAMLTATKLVAVTREPAIKLVGELTHERNHEHPTDQSSARQNVEQLLDRSRALPGFAARSDQLQTLGIGFRGNPRESRAHAGCLRWNDFHQV